MNFYCELPDKTTKPKFKKIIHLKFHRQNQFEKSLREKHTIEDPKNFELDKNIQ